MPSMTKPILDMCCGSRMFWFNRDNPRVVFCDIRSESRELPDGRVVNVRPDIIADFRALPFADQSFSLVVFDPPHLVKAGPNGWLRMKYSVLNKKTWREDLRAGFAEAWRVLRPYGTLIFKWNEKHVPTRELLKLAEMEPTLGHPSGLRANTHWVTFFKDAE